MPTGKPVFYHSHYTKEEPQEQDQDYSCTAVTEALWMPGIALNLPTHLGWANRGSLARYNPNQAAKLSSKLGKTHPTAPLFLMTGATTSVSAWLCLYRL